MITYPKTELRVSFKCPACEAPIFVEASCKQEEQEPQNLNDLYMGDSPFVESNPGVPEEYDTVYWPKRFRKKPVEIEAVRFSQECADAITYWSGGAIEVANSPATGQLHLMIETLEGTMTATEGDWIIKGVKGEFYPCKDDIFRETYEEV